MQKDIFFQFLTKLDAKRAAQMMPAFEAYHAWLCENNLKVNMISRKTDTADYWTLHFLDSLLVCPYLKITKESVLDFGTGGGLPGIPLKIYYPHIELCLLDARAKKIAMLGCAIDHLSLENSTAVHARIEDYGAEGKRYDVIVCRGVRILPELKRFLFKLLKPQGRIVLYKSLALDDVQLFKKKKIVDVSHPDIGTRKIVTVFS